VTSHRIILASSSPRRREILERLGLRFEIKPSDVDETLDDYVAPSVAVSILSQRKAKAVAQLVGTGLVVGSDTLIAYAGRKLGKPKDDEDAIATLRSLRGTTHQVMTGVTIIDAASGKSDTRIVITDVKMRDYSDNEISSYVATGESKDKAGSYAIQGLGARLIEEINGPLDNVVGLPSLVLIEMLVQFGVEVPQASKSEAGEIRSSLPPSSDVGSVEW
jgi:septum formation protein